MGYIASLNVAKVPASGYEWYIFLLEDDWRDNLRQELSDNFHILAEAVGDRSLVVRGAKREQFSGEVFATYGIKVTKLPALLLTNISPSAASQDASSSKDVRAIVISLERRYDHAGSISQLLRKIVETLKEPEAMEALEKLDRSKIERRWGWLRMLELKPNFCGFGVNLNAVVDEVLEKT